MKAYRIAVKECLPPDASPDTHFVMLNGDILGYTDDPCETVNRIQQILPPGAECILVSSENAPCFRQQPYYAPSVYISPCDNTVYIHTEDGRVVRPLLCVDQLQYALDGNHSVDDLLELKALRYVDASEIATLDVALYPRVMRERTVQLLEVHAHIILGVTAGLIPFLQANQSPSFVAM